MASEWDKLREFNGSVEKAFEELCAQLARAKQMPKRARFTRNGPQDGGIEFFWTLANGDVWGWQAKYFRHPPNSRQWRDIKESYENALDKYPKLKKYTICIPQDRANPKQKKAKHFMEKWEEHTAKWTELADEKGRKVKFDYWGTSEIFDELSKPEHAGRLYFWFNKEYFGPDWFDKQVSEQVANAHDRYLGNLNVPVGIEGVFDELALSDDLFEGVDAVIGNVRNTLEIASNSRLKQQLVKDSEKLEKLRDEIVGFTHDVLANKGRAFDLGYFDQLREKFGELWQHDDRLDGSETVRVNDFFTVGSFESMVGDVLEDLYDITHLPGWRSADTGTMLVIGNAGQGKTHLFCHIASGRVKKGLGTLLFFGHDFDKREPWAQMLEMLGLGCKRDELLGAVNAAAQAMEMRALILIDALNESEDPMLWHRRLAGMLKCLEEFPYVGIAMSVRTEYQDMIIPETLDDEHVPRVWHHGFRGKELEAVKIIFDHYGIREPTVPILKPEFSNPLFLVTLCKGLADVGKDEVPEGAEGLTWVVELSLEGLNAKLCRKLDFDPGESRVQRAALAIAEKMGEYGRKLLPCEEVKEVLKSINETRSWKKSLLRWMVEEGMLQRVPVRDREGGEYVDHIRFSYERFADHLIVKSLLGRCSDTEALEAGFSEAGFIYKMALGGDTENPWLDRSLLTALAIQIPEAGQFEKDWFDKFCVGGDTVWEPGVHAFIESLVWRKPESIGVVAQEFVESYLFKRNPWGSLYLRQLVEALVMVAGRSRHPLNGDYLHKGLVGQSMHKRDSWWAKWVHGQGEKMSLVNRVIDWSWGERNGKRDDEQVRLIAKMLAWFFTTSNRFVRDKATKAMVSLLEERIDVLRSVMRDFVEVDDPYVLERICAVAYGCAMRSGDNGQLKSLAEDMYRWFFADNTPPVHILARDYARGVIEVAVERNLEVKVDLDKVRPPYKSDWTDNIPSMEELKKKYHPEKKSPGLGRVWNSVTGHIGDFGIYIIGPMSDWLEFRLGEPLPKIEETDKEPVMELLEDLTGEGKEENVEGVKAVKTTHKAPITVNKLKYSCRFSTELISRIVLNHVLKLGYTSDLDDGIDVPYIGRDEHKSERMGKKYQWIAYHQTLAMIADHFHFRLDEETNKPGKYDGPWQIIRGRDIDPSCLLGDTRRQEWEHTPAWWSSFERTGFERKCEDLVWLKDDKTIPEVGEVLGISRDGSQWLNADTYVRLVQSVPPGIDKYSVMRRSIWYSIRALLVKKTDCEKFAEKINEQFLKPSDSMYRLIPDTPHLQCFLGEFPHLPAFRYEDTRYYGRGGWSVPERHLYPLVAFMLLSDGYFDDCGYDCSHDGVISCCLPSAFLVRELQLRRSKVESYYMVPDGTLFAFDPSVNEEGPSALLLNRSILSEYVERSGLDVVAYVHGRKDVSGHELDRDRYLGALLFFGSFKMVGNVWEGGLHSYFLKPS